MPRVFAVQGKVADPCTANDVAANATTNVTGPGIDELSEHLAALFNGYGHGYQAFSAQAEVLHVGFMTALNASALAINAPIRTLLDR